jgi:hypothetical protein
MESYFVEPLDLEGGDPDILARNDDLPDINEEIRKNIDSLRDDIFKFKKMFFYSYVSNDKDHGAETLDAMRSFHALFLQCVAYWIGLLDSAPVPVPRIPGQKEAATFKKLTQEIVALTKKDHDARTLVYSLLFQFSTQHPFDLGAPENAEPENA